MTRKRFIKLLMSRGETPRSARAKANLYNKNNVPYEKAYWRWYGQNEFVRASKCAAKALKSVAKALKNVLKEVRGFTFEIRTD